MISCSKNIIFKKLINLYYSELTLKKENEIIESKLWLRILSDTFLDKNEEKNKEKDKHKNQVVNIIENIKNIPYLDVIQEDIYFQSNNDKLN